MFSVRLRAAQRLMARECRTPCKPNSCALHDRKAGGIDRRQFVQICASKVFPRLLQIARLAGQDFYGAGPINGFFPRQRHVSVGVAIKKCECLDDS
jgi:hypothetical protein